MFVIQIYYLERVKSIRIIAFLSFLYYVCNKIIYIRFMQDKVLFAAPDSINETLDNLIQSLTYDNLFVITDENTLPLCYRKLKESRELSFGRIITIAAGDRNKSVDTLVNIWSHLTKRGATRKSIIINVGGGMVTDIGGFAASTFKRGLRYINIPTTLLAMVDASTGGKTGINFMGLKNEIGVFNRPVSTIVSTIFLDTLPQKEFYSGYGEMIKHSLLSSKEDWAHLIATEYPDRTANDLLPEIEKSVNVKRNITEEDPEEKGLRKALNFGHTVGHAFESMAMLKGTPVPHGYAVAWGIICELYLSSVLKDFQTDAMRQTVSYIREHYGTFEIDCKDYDKLYELMLHDKKNTESGVNFTLLSDFGKPEIDNYIDQEQINEALDFFREGF